MAMDQGAAQSFGDIAGGVGDDFLCHGRSAGRQCDWADGDSGSLAAICAGDTGGRAGEAFVRHAPDEIRRFYEVYPRRLIAARDRCRRLSGTLILESNMSVWTSDTEAMFYITVIITRVPCYCCFCVP